MTQFGYLLCDGCDECRTDTIAADDGAHDWPCCEHFDGNIAPCRYVVIARCRSEITHDLSFSDGCSSGPTTALLFYPVNELKKECYVGCTWVMRECEPATDVTTDALNPAFPPAHVTAGVLTYHQGDYRSGDESCIATGVLDRWTLEVAGLTAGDVTLTLTLPGLVAWATGEGMTIPVYTSVDAWSPFGRNRMDITAGYNDFPMLPKSICVVGLDEPGASDNPCVDQDSRCACNDFAIGDSGTLLVDITGCDGISGLQSVTITRYTDPDALPCGVNYPASDPCGVFWGTLSVGVGCTNAGGTWSGDVGLLLWCDGETYQVKAYCYDSVEECWVDQGNATVTLVDLTCQGTIYLEFTLPELDCCCPSTIPTDCCDEDTPAVLTASVSNATCAAMNGDWTLTYDSGTNEWIGTREVHGDTVECTFACQGIVWAVFFDNLDTATNIVPGETAAETTCDPFLWAVTGANASYDGALATGCGVSSDTFDITVSE